MITEGNTPAQDEIPVSIEQQQIRPIEEALEPVTTAEAPEPRPEPKPTVKDDEPVDPRAARMEQLAARAHDARQEEAQAVSEVMAPVAAVAAAEPAAAPERMIKLKVRGEIVELPESEVIARAQKIDAADQYLNEARDILREAKETRQPPATTVQPQPAVQEKIDNIAKAIEMIQTGGDAAEVKAILDTEISQRAEAAAHQALDSRNVEVRSARYDEDLASGFAAVATEFQDVMTNPVGQNTVRGLTGGLQAQVIAEHLKTLTPDVQQAFSAAGITGESLTRYSPEDAGALYKDMLLKGYRLPRPSEVVKAAAKTVADFYAGSTKSAQVPQPEPKPGPQPALDRTARKEAITQPERTAIPKATVRQPQPRTEPQRAASARQELRASRRRGSA